MRMTGMGRAQRRSGATMSTFSNSPMRLRALLSSIAGWACFAALALAAKQADAQTCTTYPVTFVSGTPAQAADVNSDFSCAALLGAAHFTGNVGINANSTQGQLAIQGTGSGVTSIQLVNTVRTWDLHSWNAGNGGDYAGAFMITDLTSNFGRFAADSSGNTYVGGNISNVSGSFGQAAVAILNNGNVGIGTTAPLSNLQVAGGVVTVGPTGGGSNGYITTGTSTGSDTVALLFGGGGGGSGTSSARGATLDLLGNQVSFLALYGDAVLASGQATSGYGGNIIFQTDPTSGSTSGAVARMIVANNGNVGIATTSPGAPLEVDGSVGAIPVLLVKSDGGGGSWGAVLGLENTHSGGTNPNKFLRVENGGQFDIINSAANSVILQLTDGGTLSCVSGCTNVISDQRFKTNIADLPSGSGLAAIARLNPVSFNWKDARSGAQQQLGFLAQNVEQVFPNLIGSYGSPTIQLADGSKQTIDHAKTLNYNGLIAPIVKAEQELKSLVDAEHAELAKYQDAIKEQQAEIAELRADVADLKSRLATGPAH